MSRVTLSKAVISASGRRSRNRLWIVFLALVLLAGILLFDSSAFRSSHKAKEAQAVVQEYLLALESGDIDQARSFWTDIHDPAGTWTMVAERDMKHVTQEHSLSLARGTEIVKSEFQSVKGLDRPIGVLKLTVRVQPEDRIRKLEIGLVRHSGRWYIYSIYPGTW